MPNPLSDLREMLAGRVAVAGRVISMANGVARVATAGGVTEVQTNGDLEVGGSVTVRDGRAVRVQDSANIPIYLV